MGEEQVNPKNIIYLEAVVDSSTNGVIAMNKEGIITIFNKTAEEMIGIQAKDVVGLILKDVIPNSFQLDTYMKMGKPQPNKHIRINKSSVIANTTAKHNTEQIHLPNVQLYQRGQNRSATQLIK